jgi:DNA-binding transcriptional regulator YiaG
MKKKNLEQRFYSRQEQNEPKTRILTDKKIGKIRNSLNTSPKEIVRHLHSRRARLHSWHELQRKFST